MSWIFRIVVALDVLLLAAMYFVRAPGEDAAGAAMREGFVVIYAMALAIPLALYWLARTPWVRVPILLLLAVPPLLSVASAL